MSRDDDDLDAPLSVRRALERADHGKKEKLDAKKARQEKKELQKLKLQVLRQKVKPQTKEDKQESKDEQGDANTTKGRMEEEKRATDTAHTKPQAEALIQKEEEHEAMMQEARYEEQSDQTA